MEKQRICCDKQYATSRQLLFAQRNAVQHFVFDINLDFQI